MGAYIRLSAEDKKHKGDSIETQRAMIGAFIAGRSDLTLKETYIDDGISGQTFDRPAFRRMLADLTSGKINCCISKDFSRLGRNAIDTSYYIEKYFPAHKIRYIALNDNYDSSEEQSGGVQVGLKNIVNEAYALEIGRKIRATKQLNIRNGCFVGRIAPYGYLKNGENGHNLVPDSDAAPIVRHIFERAANGERIRDITKRLNDTGVPPPKRYLRAIGLVSEKEAERQSHWHRNVLYAMLRNRVYCGDMVQGKGRTCSYVLKRLPRSEWVVTEQTHEGIVSRALFEKAQRRRIQWDGALRGNRYKTPGEAHLFLGKIVCSRCGYAMRRTRTGERQYRFYCTTRQSYASDDCVLVSLNEKTLKETLLIICRKKAAVFTDGVKAATERSQRDRASGLLALRRVRREQKRYQSAVKTLYESFVKGEIEEADTYPRVKRFYQDQLAALADREQALLADTRAHCLNAPENAQGAARDAFVADRIAINQQAIAALIAQIVLFDDHRMAIRFQFRDEAAAEKTARFKPAKK